ncbi:MAG: Gfo/Idh/MocA family oxidoreductase [Phycisphaerae bacterium]|nr:Gfo/Idh/MocA family oxidoreductase [Phycisphaerae bacterium]
MAKRNDLTRREFLKSSAVTGGALTLMGPGVNLVAAAAGDTISVGVVGCGKRGIAAAQNCVKSAKGVKVVALADAFQDSLTAARTALNVPQNRCFAGLDACKKLMALKEVNLVILATPPAFRPVQFAEAVSKGKHVFMEAPVAICPAGVKMVIEASKAAAEKKLAVVAGTQRRHDAAYVETMKRINGGAIGTIVNAACYWNGDARKAYKRKAGQSDVQWQLRNWQYLRWLSGDIVVERHVHNIDVINWAFNTLPESVHGLGGRQYLKGAEYGNVFDHFGTEITYPGDIRTISTCRQIPGTDELIGEYVYGTKGKSNCAGIIEGEKAWQFKGTAGDAYVQEHADLIKSIRDAKPLNEGKTAAESTLTAIMVRESGYTLKRFKRDWFDKTSKQNLLPPADLELKGTKAVDPAPIPRVYKVG